MAENQGLPTEDPQSPTPGPRAPVPESPEAQGVATRDVIQQMLARHQPQAVDENVAMEPAEGGIDLATPMGRVVGGIALQQEQDSKYEEFKTEYPVLTRSEFNQSQLAEDGGQHAQAHRILIKSTIRNQEIKSQEQASSNKDLAVQGPSVGDTTAPTQIASMEDATRAAKNAARSG